MTRVPPWRRYLRFFGADVKADVDDELSFHLETKASELIALGMSREAARREAARQFGDVREFRAICEQIGKEQVRKMEWSDYLGSWRQDMQYAFRMIRRNPGITVIAVLSLALGIGGSTALFSTVNAVLLRTLPYPDPTRLITLQETQKGFGTMSAAWENYLDWRKQNQSLDEIGVYRFTARSLTGPGIAPERLNGMEVSASLFAMLGAGPQLGRLFTANDDNPGAAPVVVLTYGAWQRRFGGKTDAVGRSINLNGVPVTIAGVLSESLRFPWQAEFFLPVGLQAGNMGGRGNHPGLNVLARLKPSISIEQAREEFNLIATRLERQYPESNTGNGIRITAFQERLNGQMKPTLLALFGAVGFLLVIACANTANLLLARAAARRREISIRLTLGSGAGRLVRQMFTESMLLAGLATILGVALAYAALPLVRFLIPESLLRISDVRIDLTALGFAVGAAMVTGLLFGLAPATHAWRLNPGKGLRDGGRSTTAGSGSAKVRAGLVVFQIAIATVLLAGAGLTIRSLSELMRVDPGFRTDRLLTLGIQNPQLNNTQIQVAFFDRVLDRVRVLPGVEAASAVYCLPLVGFGCWSSVFVTSENPKPQRDQIPNANFNAIYPGYFKAMGIPLLRGRDFDQRDREGSPPVMIVNESFARRFYPNQEVIGKRIKQDWPEGDSPFMEVIGVVGDARRESLDAPGRAEAFKTSRQTGLVGANLVIRTAVEDPLSLVSAIRNEIADIAPDLALFDVRTMEQYLERNAAPRRSPMLVLVVFAVLALSMAAIGLFGVISYLVTQRTSEIGVRVAIGAQPSQILGLIMSQGGRLVLIGVAIGTAAAIPLARALRSMLYGVQPSDPVTLGSVVLVLTFVALTASLVPALRAMRMDPLVALRYE